MKKPPHLTTLVLSALPQRAAVVTSNPKSAKGKSVVGKPWLGLHDGSKWRWRKTLSTYKPGQVNFWKLLTPYRRQLPPDAIVVVTSPGPFSASRASVSIANALAFAWDIPVVSASIEDLRRTSPALLVEQAGAAPGKKGKGFSVTHRALPQYDRKPY
jgi:hypothetical protein